jgi:hypothetical protein
MNKLNESGWLAVLSAWLIIFSVNMIYIVDDGAGILNGLIMMAVCFAGGYALKTYKEVKN